MSSESKVTKPKKKITPSFNKLDRVSAFPSKAFFVEMLTRDIELKDAILDLLDNCLDGILREMEENPSKKKNHIHPYSGFWARIEFDKHRFKISDNCGGIDRDILEKYAFRMGRPSFDRDKNLRTVGMYGIGMKRAIFKIGRSCTVTTRHKDEAHKITIPPAWLRDDESDEAWYLKAEDVELKGLEKGTTIEITELREAIASEFDVDSSIDFADEFQKEVETNYSYIIHKGFKVFINNSEVKPRRLQLQLMDKPFSGKQKLDPFLYISEIGGVDVKLAVGLYRSIPTETEVERINRGEEKSKAENAGWTIICNDRVVVYNDKSFLTGWGEAGVPKYHGQFIAIAGLVMFDTTDSKLLPVTTTKRGIDQDSPLYAAVKNVMREGLKHFTDFTNKWKGDVEGRKAIYSQTESVDVLQVFDRLKNERSWSDVRSEIGGRKYKPELPTPPKESTTTTIRFSRPEEAVAKVSDYLFPDSHRISNAQVGEECFDRFLAQAESELDW